MTVGEQAQILEDGKLYGLASVGKRRGVEMEEEAALVEESPATLLL